MGYALDSTERWAEPPAELCCGWRSSEYLPRRGANNQAVCSNDHPVLDACPLAGQLFPQAEQPWLAFQGRRECIPKGRACLYRGGYWTDCWIQLSTGRLSQRRASSRPDGKDCRCAVIWAQLQPPLRVHWYPVKHPAEKRSDGNRPRRAGDLVMEDHPPKASAKYCDGRPPLLVQRHTDLDCPFPSLEASHFLLECSDWRASHSCLLFCFESRCCLLVAPWTVQGCCP